MSDDLKYNIVLFNTGSVKIALTLDGPWAFSPGLKPDVNSATVPYTEYAKLPADPTLHGGSIEFYFSANPGVETNPDVALSDWRIVEVRASKSGIPVGQHAPQIVEYHIFFADFREQFIEPRGGRLRVGLLNAGPKPLTQSEQQAADQADPNESGSKPPQVPEMSLSDMITLCLSKMGISGVTLPQSVQSIDAPRDVKWLGNHAPTELAKLLDFAGFVFCPGADANATIQQIASTGLPSITGGGAQLPVIPAPSIDRRGKTAIFASYPFPILETLTLSGPDDGGWQFVLQDSKDQWQTPANCDLVSTNGGLLAQWKAGFAGVQAKFRPRVMGQAYRFIRLGAPPGSPGSSSGSSAHAPAKISPVYSRLVANDGTAQDMSVLAMIAVQDPTSGLYSNSSDQARMQPSPFCQFRALKLKEQSGASNGPPTPGAARRTNR